MIHETSDAFFRRLADEREARQLRREQHRHVTVDRHRLDPGGRYTLEIRGTHPSQVALETTPEELLKRSGEVGYRAYVPGN